MFRDLWEGKDNACIVLSILTRGKAAPVVDLPG